MNDNRYNYNYNYSGNSQRNRSQNKKEPDVLSWALIVFFFAAGVWPVALLLLFLKLFASDTKKSERKQAPSLYQQETVKQQPAQAPTGEKAKDTLKSLLKKPEDGSVMKIILMVLGILLGLIGLSSVFTPLGTVLAGTATGAEIGKLLQSLAFLAGGAGCIFSSVNMTRSAKRQAQYLAIIGNNQAVHIESLAKKTGNSVRRVTKDLQDMIDKGLFGPSAYINSELGYMFLTTEADEEIARARQAAHEKTEKARKVNMEKGDMDAYQSLLAQIRDVNDRIAHKEMTEKIYKLEDITREIFRVVQAEPEKRRLIDRFMTYYLPTTLKLLESYAGLEKTGVDGENIDQSKKTIENAMDSIVEGFENQLDNLYKTDVINIESDIDAMTTMMNRDAPSTGSDFEIRRPAAQPAAEPAGQARTQFEKDFGLTHAGGTATAKLEDKE